MKRSEIIDKIESYFDTVFPDNWDARLFTYSYASEILDLIEEAGMLPPFNQSYSGEDQPSSLWTDNLKCYYEWEPEDD